VSEPLPSPRHGRVRRGARPRAAWLRPRPRPRGWCCRTTRGTSSHGGPDTVRAAGRFVRLHERYAALADESSAFPGPPDLAVEVVSPSNSPAQIHAKVADYLAAGTRLCVVVDPETRTAARVPIAARTAQARRGRRARRQGRPAAPAPETAHDLRDLIANTGRSSFRLPWTRSRRSSPVRKVHSLSTGLALLLAITAIYGCVACHGHVIRAPSPPTTRRISTSRSRPVSRDLCRWRAPTSRSCAISGSAALRGLEGLGDPRGPFFTNYDTLHAHAAT